MSDYFKKRMEELGLSNEDTSNKKTTSGNNKTTSNYFSERLKALGLDSGSSSKVDKSYIDSFVKDAQSHLNSKNLSGDLSSAYDSWKERDKELRARETAIRDYLENNKDSLTEESYNSIKSFLDDFGMYSSQFSYSLYDANRKASVNPFDSMTSEEVLAEWEKAKAAAAAEAHKNAQKEEETKANESFWDKLGRYLGGVQDTTLPMGSMPAAPSAPSSSSIQSEIAYTTQDGRNVTWEKLYNNKLADEEFDRLYSQYSTSDDWGKLSQDRDEALGYKSDYDILFELSHSNVPHSADAVENNPDAQYAFQDAEKKRKYIEDKYGVDLHDGYASNTLLDLMNKVGSNDTDNFDFTSYMNEKERSLLNYIFNTQGHDAAAAFHDQREDIYRDRHIDASQKNAMNLGKDSPWLASIGSVALNLGAGLEFVGDTIDQTITGETQYNDLGGFAQGLRGGVMEGTDWNIGDFDAFDFLYGTGMSMADSATSMVMFGGLGGVNLGLSAAGQSYNDAINRGMSAVQALKTAMVAGVAEGLFETVSIGKFKALQESGKSGLKNIALDFAKLAVTNASEETLTEITNIAYDILANGGFSQYETSVRQYMNQGLSEEEARKKAGKDLNAQIVEAGASGALMGFGFGGINAAGKTYSTIKSDTNVGKNIISEAESAENFDTVAALKSLAYEMAGEKKAFGDKQLAKTAGKIDYTNLKARQVGKTHRLLSESISKQNAADIQTALVESGVSKNVAARIADSIGTNGIAGLMAEMQKLDLADMTRVEHVIGKVSDPTSSVSVRKQRLEAAEHGVYSPDAAQQTEASPEVLKGEHKVSESGKTLYKNENGEYEEVNKIKIVSTDGDVKVELDNGKTVSAKDLELSTDAEAMAFEMVTRMETTPETAQVIFEAAKASDATSATELFLGVPTAYRYGKINYEAGLKGIRIPDAIKKLAFDRGRNDAASSPKGEKQVSKQQTKNAQATQGKVIFEGFEYSDDKATDMQKASMAGINLLTKMSSLEIHVYASWVENGTRYAMVGGKKREAPNGWHEEGTNKIYIDINAGNYGEGAMLYTLGHEATHYIANWNWDGFKKLGDFLIENFGKHNVPVDILIERKKQTLIKSYQRDGKAVPGENQLFKEAYEEVVAEAMTSMFADPKAYDKLAELKKQDKTLWQKLGEAIKKMLDKLKSLLGVYDNTKSGAREADFVAKFSKDVYEQLQDLYLKAFVEADANYQAWVGGRNVADFAAAESTDGKKMFQYRAMEADEATYRDMLVKWGKMSDTQVNNLFHTIDKAMDIIKDNLEALDYAWEADIDDRAFSPVKPNSDKLYQVSLDFSTLCRKRILQQTVQAQLQEALNKPLTREEGIAIRDALMALQEEGRQIEVACALCYVESARMKSPEQIKRFVENKEKVIKEFFAGKSGGDIKAKIKQAEADAKEKLHRENPNGIKGKDGSTMLDPRTASLKNLPKKYADEIRAAKKQAKESYKPTAEEQRLIDAAMGMTVSDFTSPEGLESLAKNYPKLFDAYTSYIRNATKSKGIENDTWWRAGDSMQIGDVLIANMNRENGLRSQSWSDFQVVHILDYIAATIELATRNAKEQAYTKVPDYAELMGNTGVMINLSLIPPPKFNGTLDYDSVEGIDYKRALQLRDKYHATVGTICIGVNNAQIRLLLGDATIDYVIPYHKSGMSKAIRKLMHIPTWDQYEEHQSEKNLSKADALKQAKKYGVGLLAESDPNYQKAPLFSEWFDIKEAQQIAKMENANPSDKAKQEKYGVMYGGYMAMQNAANNYLKLCAERGLSPKFSHEKADFSTEENYWKLLIDRKMVDNVTGEVIEQQTIKPIFDEGEILRILNDELDRYPGVKADQEYAIRKVTEAMLSGNIKGGMSAEAIAKVMKTPVDNVAEVNILASAEDGNDGHKSYSERDPYSYESLISKPNMKLTSLDSNAPNNRADIVSEAKKNAAKVGKFNPKDGSVSVRVDDIGVDVVLGTDGLKHGLRRKKDLQNNANAIVTLKAGEILKRSIRINELIPSKANATGSYVLVGAGQNPSGDLYIVRSVVNQFTNELTSMDVLYAINAKKEGLVALNAPRSTAMPLSVTNPDISIAQLLDFVNKYFPDILPESVLRHYGYDARPEGDLGQDVLYQERDPDSISNRSLLANALESAVQEGEERNLLRNYKTNLRLIEAEQAKLADVRQQAYDLRFKKGRTAEETKTLKSLDFEAKQIATRINSYDRELLKIEAMQPIKAVLNREKQMAYKRAEQKGKEALKAQRERASENYKKLLAEKQESRQKAIESRHKTEMRHKIKKVVGDLDHLLRHGSKERNVKLGLQSAVASALEAVNMDTVAADERIAKLKADLMKAKTPEKIQEISRKIDNIQSQGDRMASRLEELRKAYADIRASDDEGITEYYKHEASIIADKVDSVMTKVGNTPLRNMSLSQLEAVYELYQVVLTTVRGANEAFVEGKIEDLHKNVSDIMTEVSELPALKEERLEVGEKAGKIMWNELIPVTAFDRIGSKTFTKFFWELVRGQNTFANDVKEAKEFSSSVREKYGYSKWDLDKVHEFKLTDGRTFRVTLKHMMSIYAYSKRDQALDHMRVGGFFFNDKETFRKEKGILKVIKSNEEGYSVDDLVLESIKGEMSKEQLLYVDEMQDYLTKMGAKGNEVSRVLWGIDIFKEKVYFPLKSSKDFVFQANQTAQETSLKNDGMTKETKPGASNPIVLEAFDDVWANHINRMSQYHSFVIPIENLNKILNYGTWAGTASISVSTMLKSRHTAAAVEYLTNFVKDLNGASVMHGASNPLFSLVGRFKKTAVAASMSVVVQQPTAILRAMAVMDAKYLAHMPALRHLSSKWDELQKYAPIAIIKDIGGFDAGAGRQATEWLNDDTRRGIDKVMGKIDDITMAGAAWGDKVGWCTIWESVKREVKATTNLKEGSEEFLKKAGERFTEVIVRTQVYDSTLSRSGYMRSKHESVKMMTAFMGEPTVSINMMFDAITQAKRKTITKRQAGRVIGSVYASVLAAAVAASLIYALRDDDEDEAYLEKFAESLGGKLLDDVLPWNMLPIIRDINSIIDGWDVERTDMAIFKDIKDAFDGLSSENKSAWKKVEDFAGAIGNAFGVPVKNLLRTGREVYNLFENIFDGVNPTGFGDSFVEGITGKETDKSTSLYEAIISGDEARIAIYRESYKDDSAYESAVRKALRENDSRIKDAAQADFDGDVEEYDRIINEIIREGNFDKDDILAAVKSERNDLEPDDEEDDSPAADKEVSIYTVEHYFTAIKSGKTSLANAAKDDIIKTAVANGKSLKEAESAFYSSFRKRAKDAYSEGSLSRSEAERMLVNYGNREEDDAYWDLKEWDYYKQNGTTDGYSKFTNFYEAVRTGKNLKAVISEHTSHGDKAEDLASQITSYFKPLYKEMSNSERASIKGYLLNAYVQLGYSRAEKNKDINAWLKDKD